ncbi:hypothetical protein [Rathayibacter soli]|uniref:hypothetical protein n=1 Tax=Rathayibacter soli TaxID=3144168 RepID=UPI0027E45F45|nr:hypothetical protein [Glaciibacter superstes]
MSGRIQPQAFADKGVMAAVVPPGAGERFSGYGVMGLPFTSGHYLALRHMTASSIGPSYRAVWHRDPAGEWTVYASAPPEVSCARFLGSALTAAYTSPIGLEWSGPSSLTVQVPGVLTWQFDISADFATRTMSGIGARLPAGACHSRWLLHPMSLIAGPFLSVGKVRLLGVMPNGQTFGAIPRRVWRIEQSWAEMQGESLGEPGPLPRQERLGDFMLPQRGIFFAEGALVFAPSAEGTPTVSVRQQAAA